MASARKARSQDRTERYPERTSHEYDTTPKAGTKRLFSNRDSRQIEHHGQDELPGENINADGDRDREGGNHSEKRYRSSDWPLPNTNTSASPSSMATPRPARHTRNPNSPSSASRRRPRAPIGPSKFVEGSMNDRVSQKPPVPYLDPEEEFLSQYDTAGCGDGARGRKLTRGRMFTHHPNVSISESSANVSDTSRSSSIFRFGKSIAASFNPNNWKFWSKEQQAEDDDESEQLRVLQERQIRAERIYQELKESGHFRDSAHGPRAFPASSEEDEKKAGNGKHDSGIEFGDVDMSAMSALSARGSTSIDEKRKGRVYLEPPRLGLRGESPGSSYSGSVAQSNTSTPSGKSKFNFKKPSMASLKKASLSNIKHAFAGESTSSLGVHEHQARRIPSRKDLQKQQKLVKRVSNLEERLKLARQQLADALSEPLPNESPAPSNVPFANSQASARVSRAKFVPGAMPSLPSERLLSGYVSSEAESSDAEIGNEIGQAVTTDYAMDNTNFMSGGLGGGELKAVEYTSASFQRQVDRGHHVMQSVEDEAPSQQKPATTSQGDNLQFADADADATPTKPVSQAMNESSELTPKPKATDATTKKRKSIFDRVPDDGGEYIPFEPSDSENDVDMQSDIISEVSSISKPNAKHTSTAPKTSTPKGKGPTITLQYAQNPRKLRKTVQGAKKTSVSVPTKKTSIETDAAQSESQSSPQRPSNIPPPTRSAPPPPPQPLGRSPSKKPVSSPYPTAHFEKPGNAPVLSKVPATGRQQSASPPPSAATFTGPGLSYAKPSSQSSTPKASTPKALTPTRRADRHVEDHGVEMSPSAPPMPPMPKAVRLASGEVINTAGNIFQPKHISSKSTSHGSTADMGAEMKGEERNGMTTSVSKQSFEWPDDVF